MRGEIAVHVAGRDVGRWLLPQNHAARIGRSPGSAIRILQPWIPRTLASFTSQENGWLLENGPRTRVRAQSRWVRGASFEPNAVALLQPGEWHLEWELDDICTCDVLITNAPPRGTEVLRYALNATPPRNAPAADTTDLAAYQVSKTLSALRRHQLAVLYAHLIEDTDAPANLCAAAGERLGLSEDQVRRMAYRVRDRVNRFRRAEITTLDDLGYYLVVVSAELGPEDLHP